MILPRATSLRTPASINLNPGDRGLEAGDSVIKSGPRQILFDTVACSPGDYVRALTAFSPAASTPEPGNLVLLGSGLMGLRRAKSLPSRAYLAAAPRSILLPTPSGVRLFCSTAFCAQPPDLHPVLLMDMGFAVVCPFAQYCLPRIHFLSIGSRFCSTLLSDPVSRPRPCASLSLHLHQVVKRTCTSRLLSILGTQAKASFPSGKRGLRNFARCVRCDQLRWPARWCSSGAAEMPRRRSSSL